MKIHTIWWSQFYSHRSLIGMKVWLVAQSYSLLKYLCFFKYFGYSDNFYRRCKSISARIKVIIKRHVWNMVHLLSGKYLLLIALEYWRYVWKDISSYELASAKANLSGNCYCGAKDNKHKGIMRIDDRQSRCFGNAPILTNRNCVLW